MQKEKGPRTKGIGPIGEWMETRMWERHETCIDVAKGIHVTRQAVATYMRGTNYQFPMICTLCWWFNSGDDPEEIYKSAKGE